MSQWCDPKTGCYSSLPEVQEQCQEEEDKPPVLQEEDTHLLQELLCDLPPHANHLFSHIASNPGTPSQNPASTSNPTPTIPTTNPPANPAPNPAQNPLAMAPVPTGMDLTIWANNQALIMSLIPMLQMLTSQNQAPPRPPKEADVQALVKFLGDENSKLWDFLFKYGLVFDTKPHTYATDWAWVIYAIQHLTGTTKQHFWCDIEQGYQTARVTLWAAFAWELETIFGDPDWVKHATEKLITLWMNENQHVHWYTIAFKEYANKLRWADDVLHPLYYWELPDCIKDLWAQTDLPLLFTDLVDQAQWVDLHYWHCVDEKKKTLTPSKPSTSKQKTSDQKSQSSMPTKSGQSSRSPSLSTPNKTASTLSSMPQTPAKNTDSYKDLSAVLGPDGKAPSGREGMPQEIQSLPLPWHQGQLPTSQLWQVQYSKDQ